MQNKDFSWLKNAAKGLKGAAASALTVALLFGLDAFSQAIDTPEELGALGIPLWVVPLVMGLVAMVRNLIKHGQKRVYVP